jgi:hypothetical protein
LERKADRASIESKVEEVEQQLRKELSDVGAEHDSQYAKVRAALAAPGGGSALLEVARELEVKAQELEKLREVMDQKSQAADLNVSALKDAIDSHADAMDVFSSDMAATVAKKLSSMQRALEGKADLSAAAACVHVSTYLKEKGIKAPRSKSFASDTARLSMEDIKYPPPFLPSPLSRLPCVYSLLPATPHSSRYRCRSDIAAMQVSSRRNTARGSKRERCAVALSCRHLCDASNIKCRDSISQLL